MHNFSILLPKLFFFVVVVVQFYLLSPYSEVWEGWSYFFFLIWTFFPPIFYKILHSVAVSCCFSAVIRRSWGLHLFTISAESLQIPHYWLKPATYQVICSIYTILRRGSQEFSIWHYFTKFYYFNVNNKYFRCLIL